jgi:hypothetical protein
MFVKAGFSLYSLMVLRVSDSPSDSLAANEYYALTYFFETGTAASHKATLPGPFVNEPSVGHGAFCVAKGFSVGWLYANVGTYSGSAQTLSIVDKSCAYSVKFARDAFARLS